MPMKGMDMAHGCWGWVDLSVCFGRSASLLGQRAFALSPELPHGHFPTLNWRSRPKTKAGSDADEHSIAIPSRGYCPEGS
jgi:hypothetical protein